MNDQQPEAIMLASQLDAVPETGADPDLIERSAADMVLAGWQLVPVKLTREMQAAGERAWSEAYTLHKNGILHEYRAMLAAAPQPPTDGATLAGLHASIGHLTSLVDAQRKLLVEVEDICGGELEDGESEIIDKVRASIAMTNAPENDGFSAPQPPVEQAPVAWMYAVDGEYEPRLHFYEPLAANNVSRITPLYTHPQPKREPLTKSEIYALEVHPTMTITEVVRVVERAHKIGGKK